MNLCIEMDEMWSRVRCKTQQCWLWHAINNENGDVIAYVLGSRKLQSLERLTALISDLNLNISCVYTDNNFSYHEVIPHDVLRIGKRNTQKIERKHLTFRSRLKRLARKTVCYSKSLEIHTILLGLLINITEFSIDKLF